MRNITCRVAASFNKALRDIELDKTVISLVVTNIGLALLVEDKTRNEWFSVLDEYGEFAAEASLLVRKLRETKITLSRTIYKQDVLQAVTQTPHTKAIVVFDRDEYRRLTQVYFDDVKYAPLAAMGIKFKRASLSEMYVAASADVGGSSKSSQNALRAINEFVDTLGLTKAQKEQLEAQLQTRYGIEKSAEVGAASQLYQRFNNIVVLGDPGSGKTCFLKHEILQYCSPRIQESWYSRHLPIYASLAEAAVLFDGNRDLLEICSIQSSRRGIELPKVEIERALSAGEIAFFFDGLDEVGYIEKRINLMSEIGKLVKSFAYKGNRFVLASRPAAVQPVDVPEIFTYVQLRGLTEDEIRTLAAKVMSARIGELEKGALEQEENELINRLINDTRTSPGIARIARNPLLLTLLVLIYANTGAVSAKRHLIYAQAIKTLVSVRGRDLREQQISEADLRTRLGALAVAIFTREINEIPNRNDVLDILSPIIASARKIRSEVAKKETNLFIQEVAEATGLLSIHPHADSRGEDLVTFMHFSFLEYYTATGFLSKDYSEVLSRLSKNPRWKDVTTLMFGILSDQCDVTEQLKILLEDDGEAGAITKYKLLLGIDCASECDVPPEGAQDLLAEDIYYTLAEGSARYSVSLRQEIADKLRYFLQGAGPRIEHALIRGLNSSDPIACAAFCDLIARLDQSICLSIDMINAFNNCLSSKHPVLQTAALQAIEARPELRSERTIPIIGDALSGNISEKHAALKLLCALPEFIPENLSRVRFLLDDANPLISELAAHCMLIDGLSGNDLNRDTPLREKILSKINKTDQEIPNQTYSLTLDHEVLDSMINSNDSSIKELAVRYVPLIRNDDRYVYRVLSKTLRTTKNTARVAAAAMDSFRTCPEALSLITISDTDYICELLDAKERNVRLAAIKVLGELPDDEKVIKSLKNMLNKLTSISSRNEEVSEAARALAKHVRRNPTLKETILETILKYLPVNVDKGFGDADRQHHILQLLYVCEAIGGVDNQTANRLLKFIEDYRTPEKIRMQSIRVYGRLAEPNAENARKLCSLLAKKDVRIKEAVYPACTAFIKRCRTKVRYIRAVSGELNELQNSLCKAWARETNRTADSISPSGAMEIRSGIIEIENLNTAYEEFSERAQLK